MIIKTGKIKNNNLYKGINHIIKYDYQDWEN